MDIAEELQSLVWVEKYRPQIIDDCILPEQLKKTLKDFLTKGQLPNLLFHGGPGVGKTTAAKALLRALGCDYIVVNGSLHGNIDTLRNEIKDFASSVSLFGTGRKYVIIDEADYLNANSTQPSLRNFVEEYSKNCGFILTCNYKNRLIEPLHSRFVGVDFTVSPGEVDKLKVQFFKRICAILNNENVTYDKNVLVNLIKKHFPDMRRIINELERYAAGGTIDSGILVNVLDENFDKLTKILQEKKFNDMRKWVAENAHLDTTSLIRKIYDKSSDTLEPQSVAAILLICAKYQYWAAFVADQEINTAAFLTEFMMEANWK
jgi:DNA polymerase III delta prime subunit